MDAAANKKLRQIKTLMAVAVMGLVLTVFVSFPIVTHTGYLGELAGSNSALGGLFPDLAMWVDYVADAVASTDQNYPFLFYMSDWLVFAHIAIALFFIGAYRDPVRNIWIIEAGLISCILVIPLAAIAGEVRGIPVFWRLGDMSFGIVCFVPLWFARKWTKELEKSTPPSKPSA
jgi:hypothetical protein